MKYQQNINNNPSFSINYFKVENEIEFLTASNNCFEIIIAPQKENVAIYQNIYGKKPISNSLIGVSTSHSKLVLLNSEPGFHIRLSPQQLSSITNVPFNQFAKNPIELEDIFGKKFRALLANLENIESEYQQARLIEDFFRKQIESQKINSRVHLLNTIEPTETLPTVYELQQKLKLSEKSLERYFQINVGISARDYLNIERFNKLTASLSKSNNILQNALDAGYYDQSHFIKHCKKITGMTPSKFFKAYDSILSGTYNL